MERGKSWIDVALSSQSPYHRKGSWDVHRTTWSDHNPITFNTNGVNCDPLPPGHPWLNQRQLFKLLKATKDFFKQIEPEMENIKTKAQLDWWIERLNLFIQQASTFCVPRNSPFLKIPWWDSELETQRKKTRALRARFLRCRHTAERQTRRQIFKREAALYNYLIKSKSRASFEKTCLQITK
ncbi:hypothetical protein AVEN_197312-1 [Araneus ventricosus]|uniref:Endonuclease/exonuclease/phosphatase domain-containing protein n=1 Tax=Araneus ventricosus TaxID=182803 RepID=A0A4Y2EZ99_ARAVE|nr:hypothetical protein AVEN_197312-1 [Araneus ventricosus]